MKKLMIAIAMVIVLTILAIVTLGLGCSLARDLWREWRRGREIRTSLRQISEGAEQSCRYMTKRSMASRFDFGHYSGVFLFPCGGRLVYLKEDTDATFRRLAAGKTDYDPTVDVDRYFVVCPVGGGEPHECPAWDAVRRALQFAKEKRAGYESRVIPEDIDEYGFDDASKMAWVHKYDDLAAPFGYYVEPIGAVGVAEIVAAGEKCVHRRKDGGNGGNGTCNQIQGVHGGDYTK